jgi:hypothetical protein
MLWPTAHIGPTTHTHSIYVKNTIKKYTNSLGHEHLEYTTIFIQQ